jgi:hypothetical protein
MNTAKEVTPKRHYYEHDGALRAYANRSFVFALSAIALAFFAICFAAYVRMQPPTIVQVDRTTGEARLISGSRSLFSLVRRNTASAQQNTAPSDLEGRAVVRKFLENYLNYTPASANKAFATALNMMTGNLRGRTMQDMRQQDLVTAIHDDEITSNVKIRSIEPIAGAIWTYNAYGAKEVHRIRGKNEMTDRLMCRYFVRLAEVDRNEYHPNGLLVAEYSETQMMGDKEQGLMQTDSLFQNGDGEPASSSRK